MIGRKVSNAVVNTTTSSRSTIEKQYSYHYLGFEEIRYLVLLYEQQLVKHDKIPIKTIQISLRRYEFKEIYNKQ
jgi:hypothetical protein